LTKPQDDIATPDVSAPIGIEIGADGNIVPSIEVIASDSGGFTANSTGPAGVEVDMMSFDIDVTKRVLVIATITGYANAAGSLDVQFNMDLHKITGPSDLRGPVDVQHTFAFMNDQQTIPMLVLWTDTRPIFGPLFDPLQPGTWMVRARAVGAPARIDTNSNWSVLVLGFPIGA